MVAFHDHECQRNFAVRRYYMHSPDTLHTTPLNASVFRPLTGETMDNIHQATLNILKTTGMWIGAPALLATARDHGFRCADARVYFDQDDIEQALARAGKSFTLLARDPKKTITMSTNTSLIGMGRSAPFITLPGGRQRSATTADFIECIKLGQILDDIDLPGPLVFPGNVPTEQVYRFMMASQILYTDKPFCLLHEADIDLLCMAFEIDRKTIGAGPDEGRAWGQTTVNIQSPLALSKDQGEYLLAMARCGIPISISPTPAAGSSGPCSLVGNLILNNAEVLAALVLIQLVRPGLPVLYGTFPCGSDMRSMMATYGGPETRKMEAAASQMAARYGLLTRGNVCLSDAQDLDFQAGAESSFNLISALASGISYLPGCGIAGGFATASREKLVLDAELVASVRHFLAPLRVDTLPEVEELIKQVGPKGSYITSPHTLKWFRKELHHPAIFSRMSNQKWIDRNENIWQLAAKRADQLLNLYTPPQLETGLARHLRDDMAYVTNS